MLEHDPRVPEGREGRLAIIRSFVADRLFRKPEEVTAHSRLVLDLGADSLDFIDFHFQLEKHFGVHFKEGEFFDFSFQRITAEGVLKPEALQQARKVIPSLRDMTNPERVFLGDVLSRLTVETLLLMVESRLPTGID